MVAQSNKGVTEDSRVKGRKSVCCVLLLLLLLLLLPTHCVGFVAFFGGDQSLSFSCRRR